MDARGDFAIIVVPVVFMLLAGFAFWTISRSRLAKIQARVEMQNKVIEKFASVEEFAQFMNTESGRKVLDLNDQPLNSPAERIISSVQKGIILSLLGLTGIILSAIFHRDGGIPGLVISSLALALGFGFLIAAAVSHKLAKQLGLLKAEK